MDVTAHYEIRSLGQKVCIVDWWTTPVSIPFVTIRKGSVFFRRRSAILPWRKGVTVWSKWTGYAPGEIMQAIREDILAQIRPDDRLSAPPPTPKGDRQ